MMNWWYERFLRPFVDNCGSGIEACARAPLSTMIENLFERFTHTRINLTQRMRMHIFVFVCTHAHTHFNRCDLR